MENPIPAIKDLLGVEKSLSEVRALLDSKKAKLEKARARKRELETRPKCLSDTMSQIKDFIDASADYFVSHKDAMVKAFSEIEPANRQPHYSAPLIGHPHAGGNTPVQQAWLQAFMCFAMRDQMLDAARRMCEMSDWSESGPALVERQREIAALTKEIFRLEVEINEMRNKAAQMGFTI